MMMNLMTVLVKKVFISSKPSIVCLLCPPPCGPFSIQESAVGGLSYKVKKAESYSLILLLCTSQCHNITHLFECQYFFEIFKYFSYSNIKILSKPYVFIPVLILTNFMISFSFFLNFPVDFFRKIRYDNKA